MIFQRHARPQNVRILKLFVLLILILVARQGYADCASDAGNGWAISQLCGGKWDDNTGAYLGSFCSTDWGTYLLGGTNHKICKQEYSEGWPTCYGSVCEGYDTSPCHNPGYCEWDFECCNLDSCDTDLHRCHAAPTPVN
jgi:hypothetical protein